MLKSFWTQHSKKENEEFDEFLGNPIFMKIVSIEPMEAFGSKVYFT